MTTNQVTLEREIELYLAGLCGFSDEQCGDRHIIEARDILAIVRRFDSSAASRSSDAVDILKDRLNLDKNDEHYLAGLQDSREDIHNAYDEGRRIGWKQAVRHSCDECFLELPDEPPEENK